MSVAHWDVFRNDMSYKITNREVRPGSGHSNHLLLLVSTFSEKLKQKSLKLLAPQQIMVTMQQLFSLKKNVIMQILGHESLKKLKGCNVKLNLKIVYNVTW